jgi:hypothetical protein|tara:strand:- start:3905 stop:5122 length:1218 start_codon:yes stop_codon:yes gene_type:complete
MIEINPEKLVKNTSSAGELIFRGGLALQAELGAQNVQRFQNFLTTPQGKTFLLQQTLLQTQNAKRGTRIYNPAAPIIAKGLSQEFTSQKPQRHLDVGDGSLRGVFRGIIGRSQPRTQQENAVRFFDNKLNKNINLQVRYGGEPGQLDQFPNREGVLSNKPPEDFIKFRIRDAVNGRYIIFPALISGITDNSTNNTTSFSYIGRADKVYVYGDYARSISFTVDIVAQREEDIPIIWEKINYAKGLTLPQYKQFFGKTGVTDNTRPVAPIVYLTLGDMFNDAPGFFNSVNLTIPENSTWELKDGRQMPHLCQLAFDFQHIGKENPTMTSMHYDNISKSFPFEEPQVDKALPTPGRRQQRRTQRDARREQFQKDLADPNVSRRQARQRRRQQRRLDREKRRQETKFGT